MTKPAGSRARIRERLAVHADGPRMALRSYAAEDGEPTRPPVDGSPDDLVGGRGHPDLVQQLPQRNAEPVGVAGQIAPTGFDTQVKVMSASTRPRSTSSSKPDGQSDGRPGRGCAAAEAFGGHLRHDQGRVDPVEVGVGCEERAGLGPGRDASSCPAPSRAVAPASPTSSRPSGTHAVRVSGKSAPGTPSSCASSARFSKQELAGADPDPLRRLRRRDRRSGDLRRIARQRGALSALELPRRLGSPSRGRERGDRRHPRQPRGEPLGRHARPRPERRLRRLRHPG